MEPITPAVDLNEDCYCREVLLLPSAESERSFTQNLVRDAQDFGLQIPAIEALAASATVISKSSASAGSSTDRISYCDAHAGTVASDAPQLVEVQIASSPSPSQSQITVASDQLHAESTRSITSLSTRPTSYSSSVGRLVIGTVQEQAGRLPLPPRSTSLVSIRSASEKKDRRSSLKTAIGRINFRKKRTPSTVSLPVTGGVFVFNSEDGLFNQASLVSGQRDDTAHDHSSRAGEEVVDQDPGSSTVEVPMYDQESLQRSLDDPELGAMRERQRLEMTRHRAFETAALDLIRLKHRNALKSKKAEHETLEEKKQEQNALQASRLEERQLVAEIEQQREFERAKLNSRTRIKHMEAYVRNTSPPPPPTPTPPLLSLSSSSTPVPSSSLNLDPPDPPPRLNEPSSSPVTTRQITKEQKALLDQEYHIHESMDQLHAARIKVLRERQELQLQDAISKMERELDCMISEHAREVDELEGEQSVEEASLKGWLVSRWGRLKWRWEVEEMVLRRRLEKRDKLVYGPLPPLVSLDGCEGSGDDADSLPVD